MTADQLIALGNQARENHQPEQALSYYAQAFVLDRKNTHAWNNYGNVLREVGDPAGALPFLQRAVTLGGDVAVPQFNIAVCLLLMGNYQQGWPQYEHRWNFEHLAGTLPKFEQPRWTGQDLDGKTIFVIGEQGHGDNIQFSRFLLDLHNLGARIVLQVNDNVAPLFTGNDIVSEILPPDQTPSQFDYWAPIMSLPGVLGITLENLPQQVSYLAANKELVQLWQRTLGAKTKLRIGFSWSGRRDSWINQHKSVPADTMFELIEKNPNYEWINLQAECTNEESARMAELGVKQFPGAIRNFSDTAALIHHMDVVISVDTAVTHLAGALGRPTWVMLNNYAVDWRWLLNRDSSPWYSTARLFRQPAMGDWKSVTNKIHQYLIWFKV